MVWYIELRGGMATGLTYLALEDHNGYTLQAYALQHMLSLTTLCATHILFIVTMLISYFCIHCLLIMITNLLGEQMP